MLKTLMASAFILAAALSASAQVGPGQGPTDYRPTGQGGQPAYGQVCTRQGSGRLNLRSNPTTNSRVVNQIPNGRNLELYDGGYSSDGFWWWRTRYGNSWGWVRADYICGDPQ